MTHKGKHAWIGAFTVCVPLLRAFGRYWKNWDENKMKETAYLEVVTFP